MNHGKLQIELVKKMEKDVRGRDIWRNKDVDLEHLD